jgi:hypothetical protein
LFSLQVLYVGLYQLWYAQGYQEVAGIESSVTTKVLTRIIILQPSVAPDSAHRIFEAFVRHLP